MTEAQKKILCIEDDRETAVIAVGALPGFRHGACLAVDSPAVEGKQLLLCAVHRRSKLAGFCAHDVVRVLLDEAVRLKHGEFNAIVCD